MRRIVFRGKRVDDGQWVEGDLRQCSLGLLCICPQNTKFLLWDVEYNSIGQYTGWVDKTGNWVFEGDILRVTDKTQNSRTHHAKAQPSLVPRIAEVRFHCGMFGMYKPRGQGIMIFVPEAWNDIEIEVIGNIHDNPELLEVEA